MKNRNGKKLQVGGYFGNFVFRNQIDLEHTKLSYKRIDEIQKEIWDWCNIINEYNTREMFKDEFIKKLDIDLTKFETDVDYYYHLLENKNEDWYFVVGRFQMEFKKYFKDVGLSVMGGREIGGGMIELIHYIVNNHKYFSGGWEDYSPDDFMDYVRDHYKDISVEKIIQIQDKKGWDMELSDYSSGGRIRNV